MSPEIVAANVAAALRRVRAERRLTLQEVADRAGLTKSHVWSLERGDTARPTVPTCVGPARALGVSLDYLTGLSTDMPPLHREALRIAGEIDAIIRRADHVS